LGNAQKIFTGNAVNISFGGVFVHIFDLEGLKSGDLLKCDFVLHESGNVLSSQVEVRRVVYGSANHFDYSGLGIQFVDLKGDSQKGLFQYILDQKRIYELLGALMMNTEPDLRSIRPLISKLPFNRQFDIRGVRDFVETTLRSIQMVEEKGGAQPPSPFVS
jgi:hypothetical protein